MNYLVNTYAIFFIKIIYFNMLSQILQKNITTAHINAAVSKIFAYLIYSILLRLSTIFTAFILKLITAFTIIENKSVNAAAYRYEVK